VCGEFGSGVRSAGRLAYFNFRWFVSGIGARFRLGGLPSSPDHFPALQRLNGCLSPVDSLGGGWSRCVRVWPRLTIKTRLVWRSRTDVDDVPGCCIMLRALQAGLAAGLRCLDLRVRLSLLVCCGVLLIAG